MSPPTSLVKTVLDLLEGVRRHYAGDGWEARCPAHDDQRNSLGVGVGADGRVLLFCQAGCALEDITSKLGLAVADLYPAREQAAGNGVRSRIARCYDYHDEAGCLLFQCVRFEPKDFRQRRPRCACPKNHERDDWEWSIRGTRSVVYRLPDVQKADPTAVVFVVEGEKDADALWAAGLVATTNPMGAGKWRPGHAQFLAGRHVVVLPDNDEPGRLHARTVLASLAGVAASAVLLELPDLPPKGDVSDWLGHGHTAAELLALCTPAPAAAPVAPSAAFGPPIPASQLKAIDQSALWLWHGYLSRGGITLMSALWKAGKTTLLAHLLKALESEGKFCDLAVVPSRVLYVTEEHESLWAERRDQIGIGDHVEFLVRPFAQKPPVERWLAFIDYLQAVCAERKYDLLILDTISGLWPVKDENDAARVQECLMPLRAASDQASMLLVHHLRKGDGQEATGSRGSGAIPAFADTLMELRRYAAGERKDRRRVLLGYGRWSTTTDELVVRLDEAGGGYVTCGDKADASFVDLKQTILDLLPTSTPGATREEVVAEWPHDVIPGKKRLLDALRLGGEAGLWVVEGEGRRGSPHTYWRSLCPFE